MKDGKDMPVLYDDKSKVWQTRFLRAAAVLLIAGSCLINLKNIFTSCQVDAEYQIAMAYRLVRGDTMFFEMWEAHQTSAFFLAFFEWIFLKLIGSATGIMLYANAVGVICKTGVAFAVYAVLRKRIDRRVCFWVLLFLLNTYPKDVVLPDFANQQIWFALLLICCLILHFRKPDEVRFLILGAACLCLEVLSYPSCAIVWLPCVILLARYSVKKKRDILIFTGCCGVCGAAYLLYVMRGKPAAFWENLYLIWSGDESHAVGLGDKLSVIGTDLLSMLSDLRYLLPMAAVAAILAIVWGKNRAGRKRGNPADKGKEAFIVCFLAIYVICYLVTLPTEEAGTKHHFFLLYLCVTGLAFWRSRLLNEEEKRVFVIGQAVGWGGFLATLMLTDMGIFPTLAYLIPGTAVCLLPLTKRDGMSGILHAFAAILCGVMIFRNAIYLNGWMVTPTCFYEDTIFSVDWTAQTGPLKGIVNRSGTYVADVSYAEWQEYVEPGDRVLVISYPTLTATVYLYEDVEICVDSVISTPTYSERLLEYWEQHPDKIPNVVVVKYYDGSELTGGDQVITQWLHEEFGADEVTDGTYWRFYRKN